MVKAEVGYRSETRGVLVRDIRQCGLRINNVNTGGEIREERLRRERWWPTINRVSALWMRYGTYDIDQLEFELVDDPVDKLTQVDVFRNCKNRILSATIRDAQFY
jgi:hypothetical protein